MTDVPSAAPMFRQTKRLTDNPRIGYDAYRRFIQLFGKIALGVEDKHFDEAMVAMKKKVSVAQDVDLADRKSNRTR